MTGVCASIDAIIKHIETSNNTSAASIDDLISSADQFTTTKYLTRLREIKKVVSVPSKYNTIVS